MDARALSATPPLRGIDTSSTRRGWYFVIAAALGLALVSWATNITTDAQLSGEANTFLTVRYIFSKLTNSGTAWAGLGIVCGWFVHRPLPAAAAGILGSLLSLVAHYALGRISGMFTADIWVENMKWFVAAIILGGSLGLIGAVARRTDAWGLAARLVVPVGAVLEPVVLGMFNVHPGWTWPVRFSGIICGVVLIASGLVGGVYVVLQAVRRRTFVQ